MLRRTPIGRSEGYWPTHFPYYVLAAVVFVTGVVFGALAVRTLDTTQLGELTRFMEQFIAGFQSQAASTSGRALLTESLTLDVKTLGLIYLLGLTVIGIPAVLAIVFIRGFVIGFTVGFLAYDRGVRGLIFAVAATFPQNLFVVPALVFASVTAIVFSLILLQSRRRGWQQGLINEFLGYSALLTAALVVVTAGAMVKAYVSPALMSLVHRLLL